MAFGYHTLIPTFHRHANNSESGDNEIYYPIDYY